MNTKRPAKIKDRSFYQMIEYSCWELFSPRSKKALLNYKELNLIDFKQLQLINLNDFRLLNFSMIALFIEYVGVLSTIVLVLSSIAFRITWDANYYNQKLAFSRLENSYALEKSKYNFENIVETKSFVYDTSSLLVDSPDKSEDEAVLGVGTSIANELEAVSETPAIKDLDVKNTQINTGKKQTFLENSCSFSVDGTFYSSGSSVVFDKPRQKMCVRTSISNAKAMARVISDGDSTEKSLNVSSGCFIADFDEEKSSLVNVLLTEKSAKENLGSCNLLVSATY